MHRPALQLILFLVALGLGCASGNVAGGSSQQGNARVVCSVSYPDSAVAPGVAVTLRPIDYLADTSGVSAKRLARILETVTDDSGRFSFDSVDIDEYTIEVNDGESAAVAIECIVDADSGVFDLGTATLAAYAAIAGTVDTTGTAGSAAYVRIYGLERAAAVESDGSFSINDLPAGSYTVQVLSKPLAEIDISNVTITPGETTVLPYAAWAYSRGISLNTTTTGADVIDDILGFPVLIRLDSSSFDFTQAQAGGEDLRFTKRDGTVLPHEIEYWPPFDSAQGEGAAVWVLVDTVLGNDSTEIIMHWGNASAPDGSDGSAVFATANGFVGVWHLSGDGTDAMAANHGAVEGPISVAGQVGGALGFDGVDDLVRIADTTLWDVADHAFTLSCWFAANPLQPYVTTDLAHHGVGGASGAGWDLFVDSAAGGTLDFNQRDTSADHTGDDLVVSTGTAVTDNSWRNAVISLDGVEGYFYIDGVLVDQNSYANVNDFRGELLFGADQNGQFFAGTLDEIRIEHAARSSGWIKLCYENQRSKGGFVTLLP